MHSVERFGRKIELGFGSSTHFPGKIGGMTTSDIRLWIKVDGEWHYLNNKYNISSVLNSCYECNTEDSFNNLIEKLIK